jgi:Uncharacterized small protein
MSSPVQQNIKNLNLSSSRVSPRITSEILKAVENLRYGSVEIIVHDAKVVQIERKEKLRFQADDYSI